MFVESQSSFGEPANGQGINQVFLGVNPLCQRGGRVVQLYRNNCLYDQRPPIEFLRDKVHAAAMFGIAGVQHALMSVQAFIDRKSVV